MIHIQSVIMITDNGRLCVMQALDVPTVQVNRQVLCTLLNLSHPFVITTILKLYRS